MKMRENEAPTKKRSAAGFGPDDAPAPELPGATLMIAPQVSCADTDPTPIVVGA